MRCCGIISRSLNADMQRLCGLLQEVMRSFGRNAALIKAERFLYSFGTVPARSLNASNDGFGGFKRDEWRLQTVSLIPI